MMNYLVSAKRSFSLCLILVLFGCTNPYALNVNKLNYTAEQKSGVIQFSDPKLFPREHLIDERRGEITFLESELKKCNEIATITPSVIRELEVVRSIAAGVGLSIDPAKALDFNANKDIAALKNDIMQTSLEMQLQQLKRDAQLLKDQLEKQQAIVNPQNPNIPSSVTTVSSSSVTAPTKADIEALFTKADAILEKLKTDARANVAALQTKGGSADQIDTFNYRRACRDTVKSEINKTRLDSLHDFDGNALVRLQLQATVLPPVDEKYADTLGILRMEIIKPDFDADNGKLAAKVYRNWLDYLNGNINRLPDKGSSDKPLSLQEQQIRALPQFFVGLSDYADFAFLELPKTNADIQKCSGLQSLERNKPDCWYLRIAIPKGTTSAVDVGLQADQQLIDQLRGAAEGIRSAKKTFVTQGTDGANKQCSIATLDDSIPFTRKTGRAGITARQAAHLAIQIKQLQYTYAAITSLLQQKLVSQSRDWKPIMALMPDPGLKSILASAANEVLDELRLRNPQCPIVVTEIAPPPKFIEAIKQASQRVTAYDVAPAERVQAVSTAARAADAVALAASIAGTLPTHGLGASGNFAFTRSAVGKADALELAPIVVGFAEPASTLGDNTKQMSGFGWLLGPKVILNAQKQSMEFVQPLKPYDLYADLSIPGWWPEFEINTYSAWAPNWRTKEGVTLDTAEKGKSFLRKLKVPMRNNFSDMEGLTNMLLRHANLPVLDTPHILYVVPEKVSPCDGDVDFQIWGDNLWRANMVILGGKLLDGQTSSGTGVATNAIRLLPDMHGIVASLRIKDIPLRRGDAKEHKVSLAVWTPDGRDSTMIEFNEEQLQKDGTCKQESTDPPKKAAAPKITEVRPGTVSACDGKLTFQLLGENLAADSVITVGGVAVAPVSVLPSKAGVAFDLDPGIIHRIEAAHDAVVRLTNTGGDATTKLTFSALKKKNGKCTPTNAPNIVNVIPNELSLCDSEATLYITGENISSPLEATLGTVKAKSVQELPPNDGTVATLTVDMKTSLAAFNGLSDTTVSVRTKNGIAKAKVNLASKKCQ